MEFPHRFLAAVFRRVLILEGSVGELLARANVAPALRAIDTRITPSQAASQ
jgi:hypothetical protein